VKIEHEIKDVKIVRCENIAKALEQVYGKYHSDLIAGLMSGSFRVENLPHLRVLQEPLEGWSEGDESYTRDCAMAILSGTWKIPAFYRALDEKGYYPASMSESAAYLKQLKRRGIEIGTILHLGTHIINEKCQEERLLVRENGTVEPIPIYGETALKAFYRVVVAKKPEKNVPAKTTFFGRKK